MKNPKETAKEDGNENTTLRSHSDQLCALLSAYKEIEVLVNKHIENWKAFGDSNGKIVGSFAKVNEFFDKN